MIKRFVVLDILQISRNYLEMFSFFLKKNGQREKSCQGKANDEKKTGQKAGKFRTEPSKDGRCFLHKFSIIRSMMHEYVV